MRKNFLIAVSAIVAVSAGILAYNESKTDDLFSANVEALSDNEGSCGIAAYQYDDDWYEDTVNFRRCGDCMWVRGTNPSYTNC